MPDGIAGAQPHEVEDLMHQNPRQFARMRGQGGLENDLTPVDKRTRVDFLATLATGTQLSFFGVQPGKEANL